MPCSTLPLEIAENALTHCYYVAIHCRQHGEIRITTYQEPGNLYPCPICQARCHTVLLGEGGTLRPLPFWTRFEGEDFHKDLLKAVWAWRKMRVRPRRLA